MDNKEKDYKNTGNGEPKKNAKKRRPFPGQEEESSFSDGSKKKNRSVQPDQKNNKDREEEEFVKKKKKVPNAMVPYVFAIFALLFALIIYFLPEKYWGYSILKAPLLFLFGGGVYVIPVYILLLSLTWKKRFENDTETAGIVLSVMNFFFAMSIIHILFGGEEANGTLKPITLGKLAVNGEGAGFIGGFLTNFISLLISKVINAIISILFFVLTGVFLSGSDPKAAWAKFKSRAVPKIKAWFKKKKEKKKYKPVGYSEVEDGEDDEKIEFIDIDSYRDNGGSSGGSGGKGAQSAEQGRKRPVPSDAGGNDGGNKDDKRSGASSRLSPEMLELIRKNGKGGGSSAEAKAEDKDEAKGETEADPEDTSGTPANGDAEGAEEQYRFPPVDFLSSSDADEDSGSSYRELETTTEKLQNTLLEYKIDAKIVNTCIGPTVTRYELEPGPGVRSKAIANHADDIALRLAATSIRVECPIPGKAAVGLEIPNAQKAMVRLRDLIEEPAFQNAKSKLMTCLGRDVAGNPVFLDIAKMPHLLIAGATGMGKSVCINCLIVSLLYRARPDEVKLILIDPKKLEFNDYNGIPHLLVPVVTEPKKAAGALNWAVHEMEKRFDIIKEVNARDLKEYNAMTANDPEREYIPQVVIIIDELADLMMTAPDDVEASICRLAQKARAAGMHLILGTQRPSVDIITGVIKANVPSRIAFTVASQIDSRTIIDIAGAEKLLGNGDMLYSPVGTMKPLRVQGAFIDGKTEVTAVTEYIKRAAEVQYSDDVITLIEEEAKLCGQKGRKQKTEDGEAASDNGDMDPLYIKALEIAIENDTISTSLLQRRLSIGYGRAAKIIDSLEQRGYVSEFDAATRKRKILITPQELSELKLNSSDNAGV